MRISEPFGLGNFRFYLICRNENPLRGMVIGFAEWLFAYGKMIICLRQNKGQFRRFARKFSFLLKK
jgi:hypothetical protein